MTILIVQWNTDNNSATVCKWLQFNLRDHTHYYLDITENDWI